MIVVKLKGGLGNQLFQYATAKSLSIKHNTSLYLDLSLLNADPKQQYTKRELELNLFNIAAKQIKKKQLNNFFRKQSIWNRIQTKLFGRYDIQNQNGFEYDSNFENYTKNTYLNDGYWQSEKYFKNIRENLLNELVVVLPKNNQVTQFENQIKKCNSVSIHIRRGDYISLANANAAHGVLPLSYYGAAIDCITSTQNNCVFFVFSDDINWAKNNLQLNNQTHYIDFNTGKNSVFDLHLMSKCKHNIIANSSFSWWAAWLNQNKHKTVIAPKQWFQTTEHNTTDLLPSEWIAI